MVEFNEKEITGEDLREILDLQPDDICISLFEKYFFKSIDKPAKFQVNDYFKLPTSKFNTKKEVWTTIGIYLVNLHLIQPRFANLVGYINEPFTGKVIGKLENILSNALYNDKITTDDMADYYNRIQWLGGHDKLSLMTPSITPSLLKPPPGLMEKKKELFKKYKKELDPSNPDNALVASKIESELIKDAVDYLKDQDGFENFESKSKVNIDNNYKTMNIMRGALLNSYTGQYQVNESEYNTGIKKDEYASTADSAVLGSHARAINTAKGGYLAKKVNQALNAAQAGPKGSDCKTSKTHDVYIYPEMAVNYLNRYIVENNKLVELTSENMDKYINTTVHMRSPMYCKMESPCFCNICLGNQPYMLGLENFGLAINRIPNVLLNLSMKKFHDLTVKTKKIDTSTLFDFIE